MGRHIIVRFITREARKLTIFLFSVGPPRRMCVRRSDCTSVPERTAGPACTADLKPPAVDNCSALPAKQTVPGTAGDITPYQMAEVDSEIINYRAGQTMRDGNEIQARGKVITWIND